MDDGSKNSKSSTWTTLNIITLIGIALVALWQLNKMDRKLTCIYNSLQALALVGVPELRKDTAAVLQQVERMDATCDRSYIFSGIPK